MQLSCVALPEHLHVPRVMALSDGEPLADGAVPVGWGSGGTQATAGHATQQSTVPAESLSLEVFQKHVDVVLRDTG